MQSSDSTAYQHPALARLIAAAFAEINSYSQLFSTRSQQNTDLPYFWQAILAHIQQAGRIRHIDNCAAMCLLPPGKSDITLRDHLKHQCIIPRALWRLGIRKALRAEKVFAHQSRVHRRLMPTDHWYLLALAVHPQAQGQGYGKYLINEALQLANTSSHPMYLETESRENVKLYQHFGFELLETSTLTSPDLTFYHMARY